MSVVRRIYSVSVCATNPFYKCRHLQCFRKFGKRGRHAKNQAPASSRLLHCPSSCGHRPGWCGLYHDICAWFRYSEKSLLHHHRSHSVCRSGLRSRLLYRADQSVVHRLVGVHRAVCSGCDRLRQVRVRSPCWRQAPGRELLLRLTIAKSGCEPAADIFNH
jgi:hypothetical protein